MKEATGELNMTVITVVAIAAVGAFFYVFVWPAIQGSIEQNTRCAAAQACRPTQGSDDTMTCSYDENGDGDFSDDGDNNNNLICPITDATLDAAP